MCGRPSPIHTARGSFWLHRSPLPTAVHQSPTAGLCPCCPPCGLTQSSLHLVRSGAPGVPHPHCLVHQGSARVQPQSLPRRPGAAISPVHELMSATPIPLRSGQMPPCLLRPSCSNFPVILENAQANLGLPCPAAQPLPWPWSVWSPMVLSSRSPAVGRREGRLCQPQREPSVLAELEVRALEEKGLQLGGERLPGGCPHTPLTCVCPTPTALPRARAGSAPTGHPAVQQPRHCRPGSAGSTYGGKGGKDAA